jgi:hypothetical protein
MDIHGLVLLNTVMLDEPITLEPIQAILFNSDGVAIQVVNLPEPPLYSLTATCVFPNVAPGTYTGSVCRRTKEGSLASPYVTSNPVIVTGLLGVANITTVPQEEAKGIQSASKVTTTAPANFFLIAV